MSNSDHFTHIAKHFRFDYVPTVSFRFRRAIYTPEIFEITQVENDSNQQIELHNVAQLTESYNFLPMHVTMYIIFTLLVILFAFLLKKYKCTILQVLRGYLLAVARVTDGSTEVRVIVEVEHRGRLDRHVDSTVIGLLDADVTTIDSHRSLELGILAPSADTNEMAVADSLVNLRDCDFHSDADTKSECSYNSALESYA